MPSGTSPFRISLVTPLSKSVYSYVLVLRFKHERLIQHKVANTIELNIDGAHSDLPIQEHSL
jgi:hypothetical protein